jgi:hypothetical protein
MANLVKDFKKQFIISFDGKTLHLKPNNGEKLFPYIRRITGAKEIIKNSFTEFDLYSGSSCKLSLYGSRRYKHVFIGLNLTEADLTAKYTIWGVVETQEQSK